MAESSRLSPSTSFLITSSTDPSHLSILALPDLEMVSPPEYNTNRRVSFPADASLATAVQPLTSSPPPSLSMDPTLAPVSDLAPVPGPRRRGTTRPVTTEIQTSAGPQAIRRETSDSQRSGRRSTADPNAGVLRRMATGLLTPDKKVGQAPTYGSSIKAAVTCSWL